MVGFFCKQPLDRTFVECSEVTLLSNGPMESWQKTLNAPNARDISLLYVENIVVREIRRTVRDISLLYFICYFTGGRVVSAAGCEAQRNVRDTSLLYVICFFTENLVESAAVFEAAVRCCQVKENWGDVEFDLRPDEVAREVSERQYGQAPRGGLESKAIGEYGLAPCVVRSCWKMMRHSITWIHIFTRFSLCLHIIMSDLRRAIDSFDCDSARSVLTRLIEHWQRTIAATQPERPTKVRRNQILQETKMTWNDSFSLSVHVSAYGMHETSRFSTASATPR